MGLSTGVFCTSYSAAGESKIPGYHYCAKIRVGDTKAESEVTFLDGSKLKEAQAGC
jgi:hypothetical protein